jgi:hypothetical protein
MKKRLIIFVLCLCIATIAAAQVAKGGTLFVAAKSIALKSSTGFFARTQATLNYGAQVTVLQVNGKWAEVYSAANTAQRGWTAAANLTAKRIVAGTSNTASAREVALAGKGFNQEVEKSYKTKSGLDYAGMDKIESQTVSEEELYQFLVDGHLFLGDK